MSLSSILEQMEANRPQAEADVTMSNPNTYSARVGVKRAAGELLKRLKTKYQEELLGSALFMVVTGSGRDQFADLTSNFECFSADSDSLYREITSKITPSLFGRESTRNLFNVVSILLREKAYDLGIKSYFPLKFSDKYNRGVSKAEELVPLIRTAINDRMGTEIVGINAVNSIVDRAIKNKHSATITPIILNTEDEKFALDLVKNLTKKNIKRLNYNAFLVVAGKASKDLTKTEGAVLVKTVSEENVAEALNTIKSKILL